MQNEEFQGVVVKVLGKTPSGETHAVEAWLASSKLFQIVSSVGPLVRLLTFQVCEKIEARGFQTMGQDPNLGHKGFKFGS